MTTLQDFIDRFNTLFYSATSVSSLGWEDEEICEFLNTAQLLLVEELVGQERFDLLAEILDTKIQNISQVFYSGELSTKNVFISVSADILYIVGGTIKYFKHGKTLLSALEKVSATERSYLENTTGIFRRPKYVEYRKNTSNVEILVDSYTTAINSVTFKYVIKPVQFEVGQPITNLNPLLHNRIVSTAVEIAAKTMLTQQQSTQ